jgi:acyl carrier protein
MSASVRPTQSPDAFDAIRALLADVGQLRADPASLPVDADLYAAGLSSLATIDLMMALEERFDIEFPDRLLNRRTFGSIDGIARAIAEIGGQG